MSPSVPYEMPAVWVSRSLIVMERVAGLTTRPVSLFVATVVCAKAGMKRLTGSPSAIFPSSTSDRIATVVMAFVCDAMRNNASLVIRRPASLSSQPTACR